MFKVVIADDNKQFARLLESYLNSKEDVEVLGVAHDGFACVELVQETNPDILLLDMLMPRMDGIAVLDRIRNMAYQPKVVMLTAMASETMIDRAMLKGAVDYLIKPFDLECLYERILDIGRNTYGFAAYPQAANGDVLVYETVASYQNSSQPAKLEKRRKPIEVEVTALLHDMGVPAHVKGYQYLRDAILRTLADVSLIGNVTRELYPQIARKYDTTPSRVERAIRHAIELAWGRGNVDLMIEYFGYTINLEKGKPTNSEFIAMVSDRIRLNY